MLDVMSGGRLEIAFPLGTGMEYWANPINPATARERIKESIEIILQAWTEDGPTNHYGEYYTYRFLNPWPRPMQQPHPPCYIVGTGSPETIELAAELGFGYAAVFVTRQRSRSSTTICASARRITATHSAGSVAARRHHLCRGDARSAPSRNSSRTCATSSKTLCARCRNFWRRPAISRLISSKRARRLPTSCTAFRFQDVSDTLLRCGRHAGQCRQPYRRLGRDDGNEPFQLHDACRRHAALEDDQEPAASSPKR